jgi:hypothetical protein
LIGFYSCVECKVDYCIEIYVFIEFVVEGIEYKEEFDLFDLICCPMSFIFAEDIDDSHDVIIILLIG